MLVLNVKGLAFKAERIFQSYHSEYFKFITYVYIYMLTCSTKDLRRKVFGMDIIATENIVYAFIHLGHLEEAAAPGVSGCKYKEKKIII